MRFDWYSATVPARPDQVIHHMREGVGKCITIAKQERFKGASNYEHREVFTDAMDEPVFTVLHGGSNGAPHVRSTGVYSPQVASVLRATFPEHYVTRADSAIDFDGPGCFVQLRNLCRDVCDKRGLKWKSVGDDRPEGIRDERAGTTIYVGSRQSQVMIRAYEKGKEITPKLRVGEPPVSLDWCRLEVEVKPDARAARLALSKLEPARLWGCSPAAREVFSCAVNLDLERINMNVRKETDAARAIRHMAIQYRLSIEQVMKEQGSDEAFLRFIREIWREQDRLSRAA